MSLQLSKQIDDTLLRQVATVISPFPLKMFMKIICLSDRNFTMPLFQRLSDVADAKISTEILYVR